MQLATCVRCLRNSFSWVRVARRLSDVVAVATTSRCSCSCEPPHPTPPDARPRPRRFTCCRFHGAARRVDVRGEDVSVCGCFRPRPA